jgi:hypothetical protein
MHQMELPPDAFSSILEELRRRPLSTNKYRLKSGAGKSQAFGLVNKRCLPPDYSRQNWVRPFLYKLLLDFAEKYVKIPWTSITVNQDYKAAPHRDRGNRGESFLVAFGDYQGGCLRVLEGELKGDHDINRKPLITDFSKVMHEVLEFQGTRISLVFYTLDTDVQVPPASVIQQGSKWLFKRGEEVITSGLPHPLKGRCIKFEKTPVVLEFK